MYSLYGCSSLPQQELLQANTLVKPDFKHRILETDITSEVVHVYIEGDGHPWRTRFSVSADPTPRNPLMLRLMQKDKNQSLYLGRPCYFQTEDKECNPLWWTHLRYSERVVKSMNSALDQLVENNQQLVLIGHSGGGTLAMLMAASRSDVQAIVTLAGNLDVAAWAEYHNYSPLIGSLNPALLPPLGKNIRQSHYLGSSDKTITTYMSEPVVTNQHNADFIKLEGFDHNCCWEAVWPKLLETTH